MNKKIFYLLLIPLFAFSACRKQTPRDFTNPDEKLCYNGKKDKYEEDVDCGGVCGCICPTCNPYYNLSYSDNSDTTITYGHEFLDSSFYIQSNNFECIAYFTNGSSLELILDGTPCDTVEYSVITASPSMYYDAKVTLNISSGAHKAQWGSVYVKDTPQYYNFILCSLGWWDTIHSPSYFSSRFSVPK